MSANPREIRGVPGRDFGVEDVRGAFPKEMEIKPLSVRPDVVMRVPGSKSVTNRAMICCALSDGTSTLENPLLSDDSFWLMKSLSDLGFDLDVHGGNVTIGGLGGEIPASGVPVFVGNAGTAARFLPSTLVLGDGPYRIDGVPRMRERPIRDLVDALVSLGANIEYADDTGRFPLLIGGGGIEGGHAEIDGSKSSQFLSGVMLGSPYARNPVSLTVANGLVSKPYIEITREVMRAFGVGVEEVGKADDGNPGEYRITPATYRACDFAVEPDASGASYFFAAAAVTGGRVRVEGIDNTSSQGDIRFAEVLREMGCSVEYGDGYTEVVGPEELSGVEVDMNEISDTFLTLAAISPFCASEVVIRNVEHTRHQETDRIRAVATELRRLGVEVRESVDGIFITPGEVHPAAIETYDDHRIAMSFALVGLVAEGIRIKNPSCVTKTFPDYFRRLERLGKVSA